MKAPLLKLRAPGKTFLIGEYAVTQHQQALVLTTQPCFELTVNPGDTALIGVEPQSPAGQFYQAQQNHFTGFQLEFSDPYGGAGGLGASTAQFLLLYQTLLWISQHDTTIDNDEHLKGAYLNYAWNGQGIPPSGADLLAQSVSSVALIQALPIRPQALDWPFVDLEFHLLRTGIKVATHQHLADIATLELDALQALVESAIHAFQNQQSEAFCRYINQYGETLRALNLVHPKSLTLIETIQKYDVIKAIKGCGALGADILLLLTARDQQSTVQQLAKSLNLDYIAGQHDLLRL